MPTEVRADQLTTAHTVATGLHAPAWLRVKTVEKDEAGWITVTFWDGSTRTLRPFDKVQIAD